MYGYCSEVVQVPQRGIVNGGNPSDDEGGDGVKRGGNDGAEYPDSNSCNSSWGSEDEEGIDGELWPQSGVHSQAYR